MPIDCPKERICKYSWPVNETKSSLDAACRCSYDLHPVPPVRDDPNL